MANQTVTTAVNYDAASISGLLDGESITINGGSVTINADVRWNQQAAVFGDITISSSLGGSLLIDGTQIWEIPFSSSTGTVSSQNALGSNGVTGGTSGATGELTRVFATGSLSPVAPFSAMPATGIIKLRSKTGNFVAGETITLPGGATVIASGPGRRSWIHVVGRGVTGGTGSRITVPRLGTVQATGDWYELGTTNGADNQTFQFPVADSCPAIWIETSAGSGVYEIWANASNRWTGGAVSTTDKRGMFFGINTTTGVITIAERGANNAGFKPPSGCKVRIPNIILSNGDSTNYANNINPTTSGNRYGFTSPTGGLVSFDKVSSIWQGLFNGLFSLAISNSGLAHPITVNNLAKPLLLSNVAVAPVATITSNSFSWSGCYSGGTISDCRVVAQTGTSSFQIQDSADIIFNRLRIDGFGAATTNNPSTVGIQLVRCADVQFIDTVSIGFRVYSAGTSLRVTFTNTRYAVRTIGTTQTADTLTPFLINVGADTISVDGFSNYENLSNVHSYGAIVQVATGASNISISNIGTAATPYDFGSTNPGSSVVTASITRNINLRRIYTVNSRNGLHELVNTVQGVEGYNVWASGATTQAQPALSTTIRGGRFTPSTVGQANVFGTHWLDAWQSTTAGQIVIACNEPLDTTLDQCSATLDTTNGSGFTSNGEISMKSLTDVVLWTMPYFALGVTGFQNVAPTITGTNTANHTFQFQYDIGSGFNGTWLALTGANLSAITVTPATGVRLQVRATVNTASTSNLLSYISIATTTNSTAQQTQYPLPGAILVINNLIPNSRVKITRVDTGALLSQNATTGTSLTFDLSYSGAVQVEARKATSSPFYQPWVTQTSIATGSTTTVTALQVAD